MRGPSSSVSLLSAERARTTGSPEDGASPAADLSVVFAVAFVDPVFFFDCVVGVGVLRGSEWGAARGVDAAVPPPRDVEVAEAVCRGVEATRVRVMELAAGCPLTAVSFSVFFSCGVA